MSTVRKNFGLACPKCDSDEDIVVSVAIWVDVFPDGTLETLSSTHEWQNTSPCKCRSCGHRATVADFTVQDGGAS